MERNLSEYAEQEAATMRLGKEAKEKVEQALLERDQAQAREVQSRREIARLLERRRSVAKEACPTCPHICKARARTSHTFETLRACAARPEEPANSFRRRA